MVQLLEHKIHLNNHHIEALQHQHKIASCATGQVSQEVRSIDNFLDNLVDKCRDRRNTINALVANLPFIVAVQVHCSVTLSACNKPLPAHRGQCMQLAPEQEVLICKLHCGDLDPLLLDKLETDS